MNQDFERMDQAAVEALDQLRVEMAQMSVPERSGAAQMVRWLEDHYRRAGYKRLLQPLFNTGIRDIMPNSGNDTIKRAKSRKRVGPKIGKAPGKK